MSTPGTGAEPRLIPICDVRIPGSHSGLSLALDDANAYLGTNVGLFAAELPLAASTRFRPIGFEGRVVNNVYVFGSDLYVLKEGRDTASTEGEPTDHSFLVSTDRGATFSPVDARLKSCVGTYCAYLSPTRMALVGSRIYLNAGGGLNLQASADRGRSWSVLSGTLDQQQCYHSKFLVLGQTVFVGGECPLDDAFLRSGRLSADGLRFERPLRDVQAPDLENRNVQFIAALDEPGILFAGVEGGLLKSEDGGTTWKFVLRHTLEDNRYAYVASIQRPGTGSRLVAAGFDKANDRGFWAFSSDLGEHWTELDPPSDGGRPANDMPILCKDSRGEVLAGAWWEKGELLRLYTVAVPTD